MLLKKRLWDLLKKPKDTKIKRSHDGKLYKNVKGYDIVAKIDLTGNDAPKLILPVLPEELSKKDIKSEFCEYVIENFNLDVFGNNINIVYKGGIYHG